MQREGHALMKNTQVREREGVRSVSGGEVGSPLSGEVTPARGSGQEADSDMASLVSEEEHAAMRRHVMAMEEEISWLCGRSKWMEEVSVANVRRGKNAMYTMKKPDTDRLQEHNGCEAVLQRCDVLQLQETVQRVSKFQQQP